MMALNIDIYAQLYCTLPSIVVEKSMENLAYLGDSIVTSLVILPKSGFKS